MTDSHRGFVNIGRMAPSETQGQSRGRLSAGAFDFASQGDATVALPGLRIASSPLKGIRVREALRSPIYGPVALGILVALTALVVLYASSVPSTLVPSSYMVFPSWMAGPLHGLLNPLVAHPDGSPTLPWQTVDYAYTAVFVVMFLAYVLVVASARTFSMSTIAVIVAALYVLLAMCPPLGLTDTFNYLGYARLGALHGLNPYTHVIADERFDPVYLFATWRHYHSPYGEVFTMLTYPLGKLSLPAAFWVFKAEMVLLMGAFVALVGRCARQLGYDPRFAVLFVGLNPIILIDDIAGFHNDPVMLVPMMAAVSLALARRWRWAGVALAVAIGVKPTIVLLLPFLMLAARPERRSLQVLLGTILGGIALAAVSVALFGFTTPNVADQSIIVTPLSVVNLAGILFHLGGASPGVEQASKIVLILVVGGLLLAGLRRGRPDWLSGAGWATLALLVCTAWLMPWYLVWMLPLVALSSSRRLRRAMVVFMAFAVISFLPLTAMLLGRLHVNLMNTPADRAAIWRLYNFQQ